MSRLAPFRVQPVAAADEPNMDIVEVKARGPVEAAELVMGEKLATEGPAGCFRAMVWCLGEDYSPISIKLFRR